MESKRNMFRHDKTVRNSNTGQDQVDGVGPHVLVGQHHDVNKIEDGPHRTNN